MRYDVDMHACSINNNIPSVGKGFSVFIVLMQFTLLYFLPYLSAESTIISQTRCQAQLGKVIITKQMTSNILQNTSTVKQ